MSRWPIIRHVRYWVARRQVIAWYAIWADLGYHAGNFERDQEHLNRIWRGEA